MIKEIISTVDVVLDAQKPTETHKVLFKEIVSTYYPEEQKENFIVNSYKVIDDEAGKYEFIKTHNTTLAKEELDPMRDAITIDSIGYSDIRNEELIKGTQMIIAADGIFGLTAAQLTAR